MCSSHYHLDPVKGSSPDIDPLMYLFTPCNQDRQITTIKQMFNKTDWVLNVESHEVDWVLGVESHEIDWVLDIKSHKTGWVLDIESRKVDWVLDSSSVYNT